MGDGRRTRFSSHCIRYSLSPPTKGWENITHAHTRARTFITRTTGIDYLLIPVVPNRTRNRKGGSSPTASRLARARLWATYLDAENPSHTQPAPARSAHTRALHGKRGATGHEGNQQLDPGKNRRDERQGGERACGSLSPASRAPGNSTHAKIWVFWWCAHAHTQSSAGLRYVLPPRESVTTG